MSLTLLFASVVSIFASLVVMDLTKDMEKRILAFENNGYRKVPFAMFAPNVEMHRRVASEIV